MLPFIKTRKSIKRGLRKVNLTLYYPFLSTFPQRSFYHRLTGDNKSEKFFKVFNERMKLAQQEIKATVTVNTSDLGCKKKDEEPLDKDTPARKKGWGPSPKILFF